MVGEHFRKLSTSPVEPPCTKVNAAKENRNDTTYHVIPADAGISDTTRQNKKQDARFRKHDMKLFVVLQS